MADDQFTLLGDAVWLDFINTAQARVTPPPDLLPDFHAWQCWADSRKLDPGAEPEQFSVVRRFRDQLTAMARALDAGAGPPGESVATINHLLENCRGSLRLTRVSGRWHTHFSAERPASALEAIARSAAATLADPLVRVRTCAATSCSLFFADASAAGIRRWCDASVCGRDVQVERRRGVLR